jgi:catechol 2,3-dioxygenase-like lactoylglutathione lyase family enzyme
MTSSKSGIRYAHTNVMANDWKKLQDFYVQVFGCEPVSSERDHKGEKFEALTALGTGASFQGRHLRLPGHGERGPTLEIFQSNRNEPTLPSSLVRPGFAHLAFEVPDVAAKREEVLKWGGRDIGQLVTLDIPGAGKLTLIYMTDPEGNIVELQRWH